MIRNLKQQVLSYRRSRHQFILAKSRGKPQYVNYYFLGNEFWRYAFLSLITVLFFSYFFYRSFFAVLFLSPIGIYLFLYLERVKAQKRKRCLESEFKDCLTLLSANLRAGYAMENAFLECIREMESLNGKAGLMAAELCNLKKELAFNVLVEDFFQDLGERSGLDFIQQFGDILCVARKNGGNLPEIIQNCSLQIMEEISVRQEIAATISGKVFEQRIMNILPFAIYYYVEAGNKDFFVVLYHSYAGIMIMTVCLFLYLISYFLSEKIVSSVG